jgi:hypothetical protein
MKGKNNLRPPWREFKELSDLIREARGSPESGFERDYRLKVYEDLCSSLQPIMELLSDKGQSPGDSRQIHLHLLGLSFYLSCLKGCYQQDKVLQVVSLIVLEDESLSDRVRSCLRRLLSLSQEIFCPLNANEQVELVKTLLVLLKTMYMRDAYFNNRPQLEKKRLSVV